MGPSEVLEEQRDGLFFDTIETPPPAREAVGDAAASQAKESKPTVAHSHEDQSQTQSLTYPEQGSGSGSGPFSPTIQVTLTHSALSLQRASEFIASPTSGANVFFSGTTRNSFRSQTVTRLEYTSYPALALRTMMALCKTVQKKHGLEKVYLVHRLGLVEVGEESIVIAVSSPHRQAAWEGGQELLELVKDKVEVWKREWFLDGRVMEGKDGRVGRQANVHDTTGSGLDDSAMEGGGGGGGGGVGNGDAVDAASSSYKASQDERRNAGSPSHQPPAEKGEWRANTDTDSRGNTVTRADCRSNIEESRAVD